MIQPTVGKAFAYALQAVKGSAYLPNGEHCREAVKRMIAFIDLYSSMTDDAARDVTDEVYQQFFQSNSGAFPMTSCLRQALDARRQPLSKKGAALVLVVQLRISTIMCENLEMSHWSGHLAGPFMDHAYWLAQAIYTEDRVAARRLMRVSGKCMSGEFIDAFFWRLREESRGKIGTATYCLLTAFAEGRLQAEHPIDILGQHMMQNGRTKSVSDDAVAVVEARIEENRSRYVAATRRGV